MKKVELLSPAGDFECLKAAVQNGADSVYFGGGNFNARSSANNFQGENLREAIHYAKLRNVETHFTLNTLLRDEEFEDAVSLAKEVYEYGIDAIIVQDLGLAKFLIQNFPELPIHGSTQMTVHNLEGALSLQNLGFKRAVLARELSLSDIEYICANTNIEIEAFIHGALCISYSGQCLFSSMVGGRSGNRGKCAQACRLPYELIQKKENQTLSLSKGHLMSPKDLCGLDFIPDLIRAGVSCFKIEGRMKAPEYVATVTRIYRKYIDLALSGKPYMVDKQDKKDLLQIFNRGGFSTGHLSNKPNRNLIFKDQPGNIGLYIGNISYYHPGTKRFDIQLLENLEIGDTISFQHEPSKYTVSELMQKKENIGSATSGMKVTVGRMKGNISVGNRVYKIASKSLTQSALSNINIENIKLPVSCRVSVLPNKKASLEANFAYQGKVFHTKVESDIEPIAAEKIPITVDKIQTQLKKTANTPFEFTDISISLGNNLFLPNFTSVFNDLRRRTLDQGQKLILKSFQRKSSSLEKIQNPFSLFPISKENYKISLLLNLLNPDFDYTSLKNIGRLYIPLKYFTFKKYELLLKQICSHFDTYIYMPTVVRANYKNLILANLENAFKNFEIKGCVLSNISNILDIKRYHELFSEKKLEYIANYTLNIFNSQTIRELSKLNIKKITLSPELDKRSIQEIPHVSSFEKEFIVYGKLPLMTTNYCFLGQSNKCYPTCDYHCKENATYYLKDRLGLDFRILPDNIQTVTTIYNCKTLSISASDLNLDYARIDILEENLEEIQHIVEMVRHGNRFEGSNYTNGNLNRIV